MAEYDYDVFISYRSTDRPWAERLYADLEGRLLKPFLDRIYLRSGPRWEPQLLAALQGSRHLVAFWSGAAAESTWVGSEVYRFAQIVDPLGLAGPSPSRQIFVVELEGGNEALKPYQAITELQEAGAYAAGPEQVDEGLWRRVVDRIEHGIRSVEGSIPVPLLIVTTTSERLQQLDSATPPAAGPSLDHLLASLGIGTKDDLLQRYGARRTQWRPFGSGQDVVGILESLKQQMNQELAEMLGFEEPGADPIRFRWSYLDDEFWTGGEDAVMRQTARLMQGPAVIVVDPLAFYDELVRERYTNWLYKALRNRDAFVLVLAPFALPASSQLLRDTIRQMARQVAEHFYRPPVFDPRYARSSTQIGDQLDLKGWLMTALAPHVTSWRRVRKPGVVYTDTSTPYP